jgi:hypothetical protein
MLNRLMAAKINTEYYYGSYTIRRFAKKFRPNLKLDIGVAKIQVFFTARCSQSQYYTNNEIGTVDSWNTKTCLDLT